MILEMDGATVATASDARQGLIMLEPLRPHVIVSDLSLPDEGWLLVDGQCPVRGEAGRTASGDRHRDRTHR